MSMSEQRNHIQAEFIHSYKNTTRTKKISVRAATLNHELIPREPQATQTIPRRNDQNNRLQWLNPLVLIINNKCTFRVSALKAFWQKKSSTKYKDLI